MIEYALSDKNELEELNKRKQYSISISNETNS